MVEQLVVGIVVEVVVVELLVQLEVVGQLFELELDIVVEQLVVPPIETVFEPVVDTVELLLAVV